jgi:hypothetical protein
VLKCDVPSNGTRRRSCGGKLLREMQERGGRIEDAAQVFDEMPIRTVLKNARVLLLARHHGCRTPSGGCCNGVQGEHTRCGRSCSTAAANEFAREQQDRAWKTSKAVDEKAVDEIRRHWELFVEDLEVARCE